jgi:hypothetical protein
MAMDYSGNSRKSKEPPEEKPKKEIEKVVVGEVVVKKKSIGAKFREVFIEADFRSVTQYIIYDVLIPAARNTIVDVATKGVERMMYGESAIRRRNYGSGTRITYNNPIDRGYVDRGYRDASTNPPRGRLPSVRDSQLQRHSQDDLILSTKEDAALVLERMNDILDNWPVVSLADFKELVGIPSTFIDNRWGWVNLKDVQILQVREGYVIDLPSAEPIQ